MIKQIRIQNFRSLVDVTVDLDPLTVLIGRSGAGKSNFVHAIRFLRDCLAKRSVNFDSVGGLQRAQHVDHFKDPLVYDLTFSITGFNENFQYHFSFNPQGSHLDESLRFSNKTLFHHSAGKWVVPPQIAPLPIPNAIMLGAIPGLQESTFANFALRSGIGCYDFPGNVLAEVGNKGTEADSGFSDRGDNYLPTANRILSDLSKAHSWKKITKSMRAVNRAVASLTLNVPGADQLDVGHQVNGRVISFDIRQESEGFRRYLAHLIALYQNPPKQTLIFEHPETALHPGALESLAEEFKDCPEEGRGQVILTTHSPQLLHYFPAKSIRVVDIDHQQTRIGPLAPEQLQAVEKHLLLPDELLTVDPARLEGQLNEVPG
jgi:predicted ATPase